VTRVSLADTINATLLPAEGISRKALAVLQSPALVALGMAVEIVRKVASCK